MRVAFACRNQDEKYQAVLTEGLPHVVERWHANHDYIRLLTGETDATFYAEGFMPNGVGKCPPWDHAAGVLMVQEVGGYVALSVRQRQWRRPSIFSATLSFQFIGCRKSRVIRRYDAPFG